MKNIISMMAILFCSLLGCQQKKQGYIESLREEFNFNVSTFLQSCSSDPVTYHNLKLYQDNSQKLNIALPANWKVEQVSSSDFQGISAFDTLMFDSLGLIRIVNVNLITIPHDLKEHYLAELRGLKHNAIPIKEIGDIIINDQKAYWIITEDDGEVDTYTLLIYISSKEKKEVLVMNISISREEDYKDVFCNFIPIIHSIKPPEKTTLAFLR